MAGGSRLNRVVLVLPVFFRSGIVGERMIRDQGMRS